MSIEIRELVASKLMFQNESVQKPDLLTPDAEGNFLTHTDLIAALYTLTYSHNLNIVVTALRSDHGQDCGPEAHSVGHAMDFWFCATANPIDYLDPNDPNFVHGIKLLTTLPYLGGIGLGGSAQTPELCSLLRVDDPSSPHFRDNGSDHIHIQVR